MASHWQHNQVLRILMIQRVGRLAVFAGAIVSGTMAFHWLTVGMFYLIPLGTLIITMWLSGAFFQKTMFFLYSLIMGHVYMAFGFFLASEFLEPPLPLYKVQVAWTIYVAVLGLFAYLVKQHRHLVVKSPSPVQPPSKKK